MMDEISSDREDLTPKSSREGSIEVTGDSIAIKRLKKLNAFREADDNNLKIVTGLKILQSQQVISLNDQSFLDLGLTDDQVIKLFADKPQPAMLLAQDVVRLGKGFTVAQAELFVSWVATTDIDIPINQIIDKHAKFTLDMKMVSMATRYGVTPAHFTGWYETWTLPTLAEWIHKLYGNAVITTLEEELQNFTFSFKSKGMDLRYSESRVTEDAKFQTLNDILLRYQTDEYLTPARQVKLVAIMNRKVKNLIFSQDMATNGMANTTVHEPILSLMNVRETITVHIERASRYIQAMHPDSQNYNRDGNDEENSRRKKRKRGKSMDTNDGKSQTLLPPCMICGRNTHYFKKCSLSAHPDRNAENGIPFKDSTNGKLWKKSKLGEGIDLSTTPSSWMALLFTQTPKMANA
jgi:hypothetical protein